MMLVQKTKINRRGDPVRWPRDTPYPQKLALTPPTSGGRTVGIVADYRPRGNDVEISFPLTEDGEYCRKDFTYYLRFTGYVIL
jgi:hypothetical protein